MTAMKISNYKGKFMSKDAPVPQGPRFYTIEDLLDKLQVSRTQLHYMRKRKEIPGEVKRGRSVRFFAPMIDQWIVDQVKV